MTGARTLPAGRIIGWIFIALIVALTLFPILWMLRTALTENRDLFTGDFGLVPDHPTLFNFRRVLGWATAEEAAAAGGTGQAIDFLTYLGNSVLFTAIIVVGQVGFSTLAAYALSRLRFPGRDALFAIIIAGLLVPPIFSLIPNFVLIKNLGLLNTMAGLVAPYLLMSPFAIFFMRQFFLSFPREIEEAAIVDGLRPAGVFFRIVLPASWPPILTLSIITAVSMWNEFLWPLLVGREESTRVLTVALAVFQQQSPNVQPDWSGLMATSTLSIIPIFVLLLLAGRRMVGSIQMTGLK